jgi:hypothetical protein
MNAYKIIFSVYKTSLTGDKQQCELLSSIYFAKRYSPCQLWEGNLLCPFNCHFCSLHAKCASLETQDSTICLTSMSKFMNHLKNQNVKKMKNLWFALVFDNLMSHPVKISQCAVLAFISYFLNKISPSALPANTNKNGKD